MSYKYALDKVGREAPHAAATLLRLIALVEQENLLYFHGTDTAALLNIPRTTLEAHFSKLKEIGAIVPDPKQEKRNRGIVLWRICPFLAWVGTGEKLREYINTLPPEHPFLDWREV